MASTPEGRVKAQIKRQLDAWGFWRAGSPEPKVDVVGWYYMPVSNGMGVHGIPDFVGCYLGRFFAIEAKAPGELDNTTANQDNRHKEIRAAQGIVLVADDVEIVRDWYYEGHTAKETVRHTIRVLAGADQEP